MGHPLSMDLRVRLLAAIDEGLSCRAAAARFGVAPSTAIRWVARRRETGSFASSPRVAMFDRVGWNVPTTSVRVDMIRTDRKTL